MSMWTVEEILQSLADSLNQDDLTEKFLNGKQVEEYFSSLPLLEPEVPSTYTLPPDWFYTKENLPGILRFHIGFEEEKGQLRLSPPWTYSHKLNKLYAKMSVDIPIRVFFKGPPPDYQHKLSLRVFVMYSNPEHSKSVVTKCPNHKPGASRKHILESSNSDAMYGTDEKEGHLWILLPITYPKDSKGYVLEFFRFLCENTCTGFEGPNRRSFHCVFLLEHNRELIGRTILDVKICSKPGRDRKKDEKEKLPKVKETLTGSTNSPSTSGLSDVQYCLRQFIQKTTVTTTAVTTTTVTMTRTE